MRPNCKMVFKKSVQDYGWAVKVPLGTIEKMIGEKHFQMLSSRIEYFIFFRTQPFEMCTMYNCFIKNLKVWKRKKNLKRWLSSILAQPALTLAVNPIG